MKDLFPIPMLTETIKPKTDIFYQISQQRKLRGPDKNNYTSYYDRDAMVGIDGWEELAETIHGHCKSYCSSVGIKKSNLRLIAWWNVYGYGNHHCWHAHPSALLSGTFYVNVPDKSRPIEFKSPIESLIQSWHYKAFDHTRWEQGVELYPKTNDLLVWPSWLEHMVPEIKSDPDERCTISFNIL